MSGEAASLHHTAEARPRGQARGLALSSREAGLGEAPSTNPHTHLCRCPLHGGQVVANLLSLSLLMNR